MGCPGRIPTHTEALIGVVREAVANSGHVSDSAWARAAVSGSSDE